MRTSFTIAAAALALFISGCQKPADQDNPGASGSAGGKIIVASEASFPPMEFIDDNQQIVGFDVDLIRAVAVAGGIPKVEVKNVAWDGIFGALKAGEADVIASSVTITDERKAQFDFTRPYYKAGQSVMVRTADRETYKDLASLAGKSVGVQMGTTGAEFMQKQSGYTVKQYNTAGMAIIDLANGQVDGVVIDKPVADYHAAKKPEFKEKVVVVGAPQTTEEFGFVVRKGETELLEKLNAGLQKVEADGTLRALEDKWFR